VFTLAPEAEGHGTDSAIDAIHHKQGTVRARIPPIKLIASAITIGSGGSGGREGPAAQISAGFGSLMGKWLRLEVQNRRIAVAAGIGSGIGAIFRAPLGGAVLAAEILYIHDLEVEALIPALIASIVGYSIFCSFYGFSPIFGGQTNLGFNHPVQLVYYAVLGVACGVFGILYSRSFYGVASLSHHIKLPAWLKPAIGGLVVGLMGLVLPGALHMGYGWVQIAMGRELLGLPLWVVLVLPVAKIVSTSLSIGSGGSGGIFGPGMVIGGMLGASLWRLCHGFLPGMPPEPAPFVIIGMIAMFGGIAHAPLAVMLMVAEMTGNLSLLAPAMVAVAISSALVGDNAIYRSQLPSRADSPAHRVRFSFPLLSSLLVRDAMTESVPAISEDSPLRDAETMLASVASQGLVVVDAKGRPVGMVSRERMRTLSVEDLSKGTVRQALSGRGLQLEPEAHLDTALEMLATKGLSWAPVVKDGECLGILTVKDVAKTYKSSLEKSVRRANALPGDTTLLEARLSRSSPLAGHALRDTDLPKGTLVVSITRNGETIFPRAGTRLEVGDMVLILADPSTEPALRSFLEALPLRKIAPGSRENVNDTGLHTI
jgi:CIC family chloride channel protein